MGWSDQQFLALPYARLVQDARLAAEAFEQAQRGAWVQSAFIGWQLVGAMGGKTGSFQKYLRKMNLQPPQARVSREQVEREKAAAFAALERVERRFDGGNP